MTANDGIGFPNLLAQLEQGYVPRPGAEAAVNAAVKEVGCGCVLVCGEPGSGKSALAAHLITAHGWNCHFLRVGHTEFSLWRDPHAFLTSVAFQLQAAFGDAIFPESVAITVNGTVRDVSKSGAVVGVDIERLVAVPWRRERIDVKLDARGIAGEVAGVNIGELVENYRSVPLTAFRELAWFEPLRRLRELRPDARVTLWVDGLDEELTSGPDAAADGAKSSAASIGRLLPLPAECRALGNLTIVVSSRRGPHLDRFLADGAALVELDAPQLSGDTGQVLTTLIDRELADPATTAALVAPGWSVAEVRKELLVKCEGNFLFLRQYFDGVRAGYGAALREGGLPRGLDEIHGRILSTMLRSVSDNQRPDVLTLLEVLAVAQTPVSIGQLVRFGQVTEQSAKETLQLLRPLLDQTTQEDPIRYSLYHKSLRDCLTDARHATALWHVDPVSAHRRVAAAYFQPDGNASQVDGYGVLYGATHLAQAGPEGAETLVALLHDGWRRFCREITGSNRVFRQGLDLARQHAQRMAPVDAAVRLVHLGLADVYIRSAEREIPAEALEIMVRLGQVQRALESVPENLDPVEFSRRNAALIRALLADPDGDAALAARLLEQSFQKLKQRADWMETEVSGMLDLWPLEKADALRALFFELEETTLRAAKGGAAILAAGARLRTVLAPATANARFQAAFDAARTETPDDAASIVGRVFTAWARFDPQAARDHLHARGSFSTTAESAGGFLALSLALEKGGVANALVQAARILLEIPVEPNRDPIATAAIWLQVVLAAPGVWAPATAAQIVDRVLAVLGDVRAARAAAGKATRVPRAESALLVGIAEAEQVCKRGRESEALGNAWQAVLDGAEVDDAELGRLLRLQAVVDRETLEAYLETAPDAISGRLWFAAVREGLAGGSSAPGKALERLVLAAEKPQATGWSFFFFPLMQSCRLDELEHAEQLLAGVGVDPAFVVRWRLSILDRLIAQNDPRRSDWLGSTLALWAGPKPNRNFIDELPAAIAELPVPLLAPAEAALANLANVRQRALLRAALAVRHWSTDPGLARAECERAVNESAGPAEPNAVEEYVVCAFIAGQWHRGDPGAASTLFAAARGRLEQRCGVPAGSQPSQSGHYVHLCMMLRALHWGAPELALPELVRLQEPTPEPGVRIILRPFPSVSPFRVAGLGEHEELIGSALVRALPRHQALVLEIVSKPLPAGARSLALAQLASKATGVALPRRLAWCQQAATAAQEIESLPLRYLLLAEAARATRACGTRNRALELARQAVEAMEPHFAQGDTMIAHAYASALGRCVDVAVRSEAWSEAWDWLWRGRALGMHGFYVLLGELPEAIQTVAPVPIERFEAAEAAGRNFYVTG